VLAFAWANSPWTESYGAIKDARFGLRLGDWSLEKTLLLWVNDGLMAIFFLLVGLEIKRELRVGELSDPRRAALAVVAALGGMVVPAIIYTAVNWRGDGLRGWGIPMATDIAFALGVLALLGNRVPLGLKVFLTALAIVDDLGAVLVIALFYTEDLNGASLGAAGLVWGLAVAAGALGLRRLEVYSVLGILLWYFLLKSGVHATVAGVLLAFTLPIARRIETPEFAQALVEVAGDGSLEEVDSRIDHLADLLESAQSPLHRLERALHVWVAYLIMPVFALFNAGVALGVGGTGGFGVVGVGALLGLALGKPLGVLGASWLAVRLGVAALPEGTSWGAMLGVGILAGIGFTMALFIASLAFGDTPLLDAAKLGVLSGSVLAAVVGASVVYRSLAVRSKR
jgi:Na+:H+ antiporter, NhaA family